MWINLITECETKRVSRVRKDQTINYFFSRVPDGRHFPFSKSGCVPRKGKIYFSNLLITSMLCSLNVERHSYGEEDMNFISQTNRVEKLTHITLKFTSARTYITRILITCMKLLSYVTPTGLINDYIRDHHGGQWATPSKGLFI